MLPFVYEFGVRGGWGAVLSFVFAPPAARGGSVMDYGSSCGAHDEGSGRFVRCVGGAAVLGARAGFGGRVACGRRDVFAAGRVILRRAATKDLVALVREFYQKMEN